MIRINERSPQPLRLAGLFFVLLGSRDRDRDSVLTAWPPRLESLWTKSALSFDDFRRLLKFALRDNPWTAENLPLAKDPMASLEKQFDMIVRVYNAKLAGDKARERRGWKYGACPHCDEVPAPYHNQNCNDCDKKIEAEREQAFWDDLQEHGLIQQGSYSTGKKCWYAGKSPDQAVAAAPTKEELRPRCYGNAKTRETLLAIMHPEDYFEPFEKEAKA